MHRPGYTHELNQCYFGGALSPAFLGRLANLPHDRGDVRAFIDRAFWLMVAGAVSPTDLSELQGDVLGSLVARIQRDDVLR